MPAARSERLETRQRSGVDRVAAQLVARERGAIDDADARAGAREDRAGHRTGRPRADNQHIKHWVRLGGNDYPITRLSNHALPIDQRAVLRSEAEAVAQRGLDAGGAPLIRDDVEIARGIGIVAG